MFYDTLATAAVADELRQKVLGGFVQRVLHVSAHTIGFEVYAGHERHWLLLSAHPQHARVHLSQERLARGTEQVTPLLLLMRKHVRDGRLVAVDQPPLERVLILTVAKHSDELPGGLGQCRVIIEIMGRYSNVILADERYVVLDSLKRVPAQVNRYRVVLPQHPYVPPPPQKKSSPDSLAPETLEAALRSSEGEAPLWQGLVRIVSGMSPLLGREIAFRATGSASAGEAALGEPGVASRMLETVRDLYRGLEDHRWSASVAPGEGAVEAFAPYELRHLGSWQARESISSAIEEYYEGLEQVSGIEQKRVALLAQLEEVRARHLRRKGALERSLAQGQAAERLRRSGEAILAAVGGIQRGQERLDVDGLTIALDTQLSAVENAQAYFREYKKSKSALQNVPGMLAEEGAALSYLDEVAAYVELARTAEEVRRVAADLREAGITGEAEKPVPKKKSKAAKVGTRGKAARPEQAGPPPFRVLPGGFEVYVGRSARQNEELTFHTATAEDIWLHARGVPGAHVIVKCRGREVPEDVILAAARLAAGFSQARASNRVAVDYTRRKHVRRVRAGLPGLVTYGEERTVQVAPENGTR